MHQLFLIGLIVIPLAVFAAKEEPKHDGLASRRAPSVPQAPCKTDTSGRWYPQDLLNTGHQIYQKHCASCHGRDAEGDSNWRQRGPDGQIRSPTHNSRGHTWHHPLLALINVIMNGSPRAQANMSAWRGSLSIAEVLAVIVWFQSQWSDEIYSE